MDPPSLIAERFEIQEAAGTGGMATVYRALDRTLGTPVALKLLTGSDSVSAGRFALEAGFLSELSHPAIVRYVSHGVTPSGQCYIAMEWLEGEPLSHRLERLGLTVGESVYLITRIAQALAVAHARGIVHRDIKPSNIHLVNRQITHAKLMDFGIARLGHVDHQLTQTGMMVGTPGYMAPEQARGDRQIDARADVFSLGCVFFHCLTGQPAFVADNPMALLAKVLVEETPRVRALRHEVPVELEQLLAKMLAKEPKERFKDASRLAEALSHLKEIGPTPAAPNSLSLSELTEGEKRLVCVVVARPLTSASGEKVVSAGAQSLWENEPTPTGVAPHSDSTVKIRPLSWLRIFRSMVESFGGTLEVLANGSLVALLSGTGTATDLAARGARCALAARSLLPHSQIAVAMGRGAVGGKASLGEVFDRVAKIVERCPTGGEEQPIALDEITAGLIDSRFTVVSEPTGQRLIAERDQVEIPRTLLGRSTPFVGRERELRTLEGIFDECIQEPVARVVLVTAAPGIGKSRLHHEFRRRIERCETRPKILIARGDALKLGSPFGLIAPAIRRAAGILDGEPLATKQQKLLGRLAHHLSGDTLQRVGVFIGEMVGASFPDDAHPLLKMARRDRAQMGDHIRAGWEEWLLAECKAQPLLLILEDLHWGDLPTVQLVDSALYGLRDQPLMVLALARPEVHELFPKLWVDRALVEIRLPELTRKYGEMLVRQVLGGSIPDPTVQKMLALADGNAFYLEELIRAVSEGQELPETVLAMVQARLERLEPEARRVLRAGSIFGQLFSRKGVAALLGGEHKASEVNEWMAELVSREFISLRADRRFRDEEDYVFRHALVREAAYSMLTESDRALGHELAGEWLEQMGETEAVVLAEHLMRGKKPQKAIKWFCKAAMQALEGNDLDRAIERAQRGMECGALGDELGTLMMLAAEAFYWKGAYAKVEEYGEKALASLPLKSERWCITAGLLAEAYSRLHRPSALIQLGEQLGDLAFDQIQNAPLCVAVARIAKQFILVGNLPFAEILLKQLEPVPAQVPMDPITTAWVEDARAVRALFKGDLGAYLEMKTKVVEAYRRAEDQRSECIQRVRLGYGCSQVGDFGRAAQELLAALEKARALGVQQASALAKHNLGYVFAQLGRLEEAKALESQAIREYQAQGDARLTGASHKYLAMIFLQMGDLPSAEREVEQSLRIIPRGSPTWVQALAVRARVRLAKADASGALEDAALAMKLLEEMGGVDEGEALLRLMHAQALFRKGDLDAARRAIAQYRDRLLERAQRISDARLRESFLKRVPENAATLAFAETGQPPNPW